MQVASTLWPDIKSQKISERRFRLIGPSVAQEPLQIHSRQAETSMDQTREAKTAHKKGDWGWLTPWAGRPTTLVGRPGPWAPPPQLCHVSPPHCLLKSVLQVSARGSLL